MLITAIWQNQFMFGSALQRLLIVIPKEWLSNFGI